MPLAFTFVLGGVSFAQDASQQTPQKKVGINTADPKFDLDVKGTVRVSTLGDTNNEPHLVGWDKDSHQVVDMGAFSALKFFQTKHVEIPVTRTNVAQHASIGVEAYDLKIDASKYSIIITEPKLVYSNGNNKDKTAYMKIVSVQDKDMYVTSGRRVSITYGNGPRNVLTNVTVASLDHNALAAQDGTHTLQGTLVKTDGTAGDRLDRNPLLYEVPKIVVFKDGNKWKFTGKYYFSAPADDSQHNYKWVFDMLIMDNSWVQYGRNVTMKVKNDASGNPTVAEVESNTREAK